MSHLDQISVLNSRRLQAKPLVRPTGNDITGDIMEIEKALGTKPDGVLLKSEVENIIHLQVPGVNKEFWRGIYENWHNYDNDTVKLGKKSTKGSDNVLTANDIIQNLSYQA